MKISYNLLKQFVNFELSPQKLASVLTSLGIEASVVPNEYNWTNVYTAKILDVQKHIGTNKLFLCKVSDGIKKYSIVCGAKNIDSGQIVPLAKIGAVLAGNFKIQKLKIRGVESEGMLCSEKDLGITTESNEILILDEKTKIGEPLENILSDNYPILEIEVTTNRSDCLSHLGIAREIGAKLRKSVSLPTIKTFNIPTMLNTVEVKSNLCSRYAGSIISGVKISPSPKWLTKILDQCEIKPINNIVDITNYVMIELGQPLHAFDISKLSSEKIIVRNASDIEKITALDGKEYNLNSDMLVIADSQKPITIAGIIGGECSCIDKTTKTIFLESAIFDATSIRKTSKKLNLLTNSSYRFERGVDHEMTEFALWRAATLITDIAGGKIEAKIDLKNIKTEKIKIDLRVERVAKVLGYTVKANEITEILKFLGIDSQLRCFENLSFPNVPINFFCTIPSWRTDIKEEIDLIEEIVRIKGYDTVHSFKTNTENAYIANNSFPSAIVEKFRVKLNNLGFSEALNYSFSEIKELEKFYLKYYYKILNPISRENEVLRPSLLPGLYKNLLLNIRRGAVTVTLFEHGKIFNEFGERKTFAAIMCGRVWQEWWKWTEQKINPKYDFYFGGGIVKTILPSDEFVISENLNPLNYYHSGKIAAVVYREKIIGQFGILKPSITEDTKDDVFYFEIDLEEIEEKKSFDTSCPIQLFENNKNFVTRKETEILQNKFPAVKRDISITADKNLLFARIEKVIKSVMETGKILKEYLLFSVYADEFKLGKDKVSYSLRLSYRNNDRTLSDEEVNNDIKILLQSLDRELGVKLRQQR
jgi:phenylalanyl-tRNA synthetase beta chain